MLIEKISFIAGIVSGVSKDEIIMILQSCDYVVEKAVARIEEEGVENILQEWRTQKGGFSTATSISDRKSKKAKSKPVVGNSQVSVNPSNTSHLSPKRTGNKPTERESTTANNSKRRNNGTESLKNKSRELPSKNLAASSHFIDVNDISLDDLKSKLVTSSQSIDIKHCQLKLNIDGINLKFADTFNEIKQSIHDREQYFESLVNKRGHLIETKLIEIQKRASDLRVKCESAEAMNEQQIEELKADILNYLADSQINTDAMEFNFSASGTEEITKLIGCLGAVHFKAPIEHLCKENSGVKIVGTSSKAKKGEKFIGSANDSRNNSKTIKGAEGGKSTTSLVQKTDKSKKHKTIRDTVSEALKEALGIESNDDNLVKEVNTEKIHQQSLKKAKGKQNADMDNAINGNNFGNRSNRQVMGQSRRGRNARRGNKAKQRQEEASKAVGQSAMPRNYTKVRDNSRPVEDHKERIESNSQEYEHSQDTEKMDLKSNDSTMKAEMDTANGQTTTGTSERRGSSKESSQLESCRNENLGNNKHNGNHHIDGEDWREDINPANGSKENLRHDTCKDFLQHSTDVNQISEKSENHASVSLPQRSQKSAAYTNGNGSLDDELDLDE
ncbi:hypothetical protein TrispH2_006036 [Trichoplax sp. H2]|nr:hypothetical protein TrispH2_006036 [Trichoplax sp. H2]|eukprot:RDD41021.1 hypothetical protein TrispH2_006036 [Trichoplax sp. H2]